MDLHQRNLSRRDLLRWGATATAGLFVATHTGWRPVGAVAAPLRPPLSDPAAQPKFLDEVPNALDPGFRFAPDAAGEYHVGVAPAWHHTGLVNSSGTPVPTRVFGYGADGLHTWPGRTFEVVSGSGGGEAVVHWYNQLFGISEHLVPVDTSLHWAYSLHGYESRTIDEDGIPIVVHLHGGHSDFQYDGNPEFFWSPGEVVTGPQWELVPGGFTNRFVYDTEVPAGTLWYHDHALGITRLNVYAGMAGFFIVRDDQDTGTADNPLGLPAFPYEYALAIQDRMFRKGGQLFYPALPPDPAWADFITGEGLANGDVPKPSALAEFFGDHMVVNGKIWPKASVEPRHYRLRLLNGCDSRFLVVQFRPVAPDATDLSGAGEPLAFHVIGSDQGLATAATEVDTLVVEPGGRYDVVVDFSDLAGGRVVMANVGGDAPFGGDFGDDLDADDLFPDRQTDRIMAFDVVVPLALHVPDVFDHDAIAAPPPVPAAATTTRRVALFEGRDQYGRLQPLLGTAEGVVDASGESVAGAIPWHAPTTERPALDDTEVWEVYNATGDAHPVHLHLVNFAILDRHEFTADVVEQPILQHDGTTGVGFRLEDIAVGAAVDPGPAYVEKAPKDVVTALPGQVTRIRATFDKPGRYVWHCHILSHEDHEMMRVLEVVGPA
ncbi:multicopper oxidase family protein [Salsipaludibacter albus]|uniref:multicopper oxidase family protein n=1 Tax=Salsipaludibacter albus TaxID=2849650 RepID=UPI002368ADD3|nr:multicopper oxidase domain-containing protein [Salsipaludibacter albus]MBY5162979.1 multicopper oxidase domain-containing protein [Salsipaludibacter albus]